jgi:hypothetical protein
MVVESQRVAKPRAIRSFLGSCTVHFTPTHGSWLNQAEIDLRLVARGCLGRRRIASFSALDRDIRTWTTRANRARTRIDWRFARRDARTKFGSQRKLSSRSKT